MGRVSAVNAQLELPKLVSNNFLRGNLENIDQLKAYSAMAETSRKWVSAMDTKAGFLSALNAATLAFVWSGAKLSESQDAVYYLVLVSTLLFFCSLVIALKAVLPRITLSQVFGGEIEYSSKYEPISFFGHVAEKYPLDKHAHYISLVKGMDTETLALEALEQHFTICHIIQKKASLIEWSGWVWLIGASLVIFTLIVRG